MNTESINDTELELSGNSEEFEEETEDLDNMLGDLLITTKTTFDRLLKVESKYKKDAISLYMFYCYTSNWQGTRQPKATEGYVLKGLEISREKMRSAKKILLDLGLIEDVKTFDKNNKISGHYIKIKYVPSIKKAIRRVSTRHVSHLVAISPPNACIQLVKYSKTDNETPFPAPQEPSESLPKRRVDQDIIDTIEAFRQVNPMVDILFRRPAEREAAQLIFNTVGLAEIKKVLQQYSLRKTERFAPVVTTPAQFANSFERLKIFLAKDNGREAYNMKTLQGKHQTPVIEVKSLNPFYKPQD